VTTFVTGIDGAYSIAFNAKNSMLYIAEDGEGEVAAVSTKGVVTEIDLLTVTGCAAGYYPRQVDVAASTGMVYVSVGASNYPYECVAEISGTKVVATTDTVYAPFDVSVNQYKSKSGSSSVVYVINLYGELYACNANLTSCSVIATFSEGLSGIFYTSYDKSVWVISEDYVKNEIIPIGDKNVVGTPVSMPAEGDAGCSAGKTQTVPLNYYEKEDFTYNIVTNKSTIVDLSQYYPFACAYS
jgi:hypothetical protein